MSDAAPVLCSCSCGCREPLTTADDDADGRGLCMANGRPLCSDCFLTALQAAGKTIGRAANVPPHCKLDPDQVAL